MPTYSVDAQLPTFYERTRSLTPSLPVYAGGSVPAVVASGVFTLYDQSKAVVVSGVTVPGADGSPTYPVLATDLPSTRALSGLWQEEWALTFADGHVETFRRDAYLCLRVMHGVVTDPMLTRRVPDLAAIRPPTQTSYEPQILEAFGICQRSLLADGRRPYLVLNDYALADWHAAVALGLIFRMLSTYSGEGRFSTEAERYEAMAVVARDHLKLEYDDTEANQRAAASPGTAARPLLYANYGGATARPYLPQRRAT